MPSVGLSFELVVQSESIQNSNLDEKLSQCMQCCECYVAALGFRCAKEGAGRLSEESNFLASASN